MENEQKQDEEQGEGEHEQKNKSKQKNAKLAKVRRTGEQDKLNKEKKIKYRESLSTITPIKPSRSRSGKQTWA